MLPAAHRPSGSTLSGSPEEQGSSIPPPAPPLLERRRYMAHVHPQVVEIDLPAAAEAADGDAPVAVCTLEFESAGSGPGLFGGSGGAVLWHEHQFLSVPTMAAVAAAAAERRAQIDCENSVQYLLRPSEPAAEQHMEAAPAAAQSPTDLGSAGGAKTGGDAAAAALARWSSSEQAVVPTAQLRMVQRQTAAAACASVVRPLPASRGAGGDAVIVGDDLIDKVPAALVALMAAVAVGSSMLALLHTGVG